MSMAVTAGPRVAWLLADEEPPPKPRIAAIVTEYRGYSHADVILGRFLQGHTLNPKETYWPRTQVVSMYVDQFPPNDMSRGMAASYGVRMAPTIQEALTLGTDHLDVDGVLIIGEHGDYPHNAKGQHMYPRRDALAWHAAWWYNACGCRLHDWAAHDHPRLGDWRGRASALCAGRARAGACGGRDRAIRPSGWR